jgi:hypothetical protein
MLELFDYRLNQCFCHEEILSLVSLTLRQFLREEFIHRYNIPDSDEIPLWAMGSMSNRQLGGYCGRRSYVCLHGVRL